MQILNDLKEDIATSYTILDNKINELSKEIKSVRNPPYESYCGYNYNSQDKDSTTLTYNSPLLHSSTNLGGSGACPPGGCPAHSGLSADTGVYTCTWPGDYQVTWSTVSLPDSGDQKIYIYLYRNGEQVGESVQEAYYGGERGYVADTGARTLFTRMEIGDTLELVCEDCSGEVFKTIFCISLVRFDVF